jgi:predicted transcriptional regulator
MLLGPVPGGVESPAAKEWTQEILADKAGLSWGYIARLEIGRHDPSLSMLVKLVKASR